MKKITGVILIAFITIMMIGCSNSTTKTSNQEDKNILNENSETEPVTESESSEEIKYANMIPDPIEYFKNGEISIVDSDGGTAYIFQVRNFQDGEYEAYVDKCKEMGFSDISYESENDGGKMFGAYSGDGEYWVEVLLGNDNGILAVTCKESTKK